MSALVDYPRLLLVVAAFVLFGILELGFRLAGWIGVAEDEEQHDQVIGIRDALLVLMSLLLGFTLAMAVPRFDHRRQLVLEESNAISTTYLRAGLLAQPSQDDIRALLREYVDARLYFFRAGLDQEALEQAEQHAKQLQEKLWAQTARVTQSDRTAISATFVQSLNEMIDLDAKRLAALENRIPTAIWVLILSVAVLTVLTLGCAMRKRFWYPVIVMPLMIATVIALIADLDSPRTGFIRIDQRPMQRLKADFSK